MNLFQSGNFTLAQGEKSFFKIECDALTEDDITTLARLVVSRVPRYASVFGVPNGGIRLAKALEPYATEGFNFPRLVVDDVLSTGKSMRAAMTKTSDIGVVIFARAPIPFNAPYPLHRVRALFTLTE